MRKTLPIFYSALLLTGVNLLLRFVATSFQVHISGRIGAEGVGLLQLVLSVGAMAMTAGMAGIRTATMYLTAEELGRNRPQNIRRILRGCFCYSLLCSGTISFGLYTFAPQIARHWIGNIHTVDAIRLYACFLPIVCLTGCMTGYYTAENRITTLAGIEIGEQLCYMVVTLLTLNLWAGNDAEKACEAVVLGSGISSAITLCILIFLQTKRYPPASRRLPVAKRILGAALPLAMADNLKAGISTTENLMVPKRLALFAGELTPLATFGVVIGMVFPVLMFPAAILFALAELLIPELARCSAAESKVRIRYLVRKGLKVSALYGCLCGGTLYLIAEPLCNALYHNEDAGRYLKLYSLLAPMLYCDAITDAMTKGLGQQRLCVKYNIITSAMDVTFLYLLLPKYGMMGYFWSFFLTHLINFLLSIRRLLKITGIKIPFYLPALLLGLGGLSASLAALINGFMRIPCFFAIFLCLLTLCRIVGKRDLLWIRRLTKKYDPSEDGSQNQRALSTSSTNS